MSHFYLMHLSIRKIKEKKIEKKININLAVERVQKGIAYWDKQNNDVPAPNCMLKVQGEIIKVEGL